VNETINKLVWDLEPDDIVIISNIRYQWSRDFQRTMPKLGRQWHRELLAIDGTLNSKGQTKRAWFVRDIEVPVIIERAK